MYERRLIAFSMLLAAGVLLLAARLFDIQVLRADEFEALAERRLTRTIHYLAAPRGAVFDRNGLPLIRDVPASDISLHYAILSGDSDGYLRAVARKMRERGDVSSDRDIDDVVLELNAQIDDMWHQLAEITGLSIDELLKRAGLIEARVERVKNAVARRTGRRQRVTEENTLHALVEGVDGATALRVREQLERYTWLEYPILRVEPGSRRQATEARELVHLLGRLGDADPARIDADSLRDDELRALRPGDRCGVSGVEWLADTTLRGARGRIVEDFGGQRLEYTEPQPGDDVNLTIDAELQRGVFEILAQAVHGGEAEYGGASAVVIDVATREVLALVGYPAYSPDEFAGNYDALRTDTRWEPLRFRAVANQYPPGSTCKAITLYAALADGVVNPETTITCDGHFRPDQPDAYRCWIYNQYRATHGRQNAIDAIRNSCNIYFYTCGDRLGPERLCEWFQRFGLGRSQGTGLIEETNGIVPTAEWLFAHRPRDPRPHAADAWNYAIGQGEVSITPLQAANVAATIAAGRWAPVRLARRAAGGWLGSETAAAGDPLDESLLRVLRDGMWRVVNDPGGTGADALIVTDGHVLCGKTGSAQASRRVLSREYECRWADGHTQIVIAPSKPDAEEMLADDPPQSIRYEGIHDLFPPRTPDGKLPSHAWFIGYTQGRDTPRGGRPRGRALAISVLIEYGGSGGHVAGPVAKRIVEMALACE